MWTADRSSLTTPTRTATDQMTGGRPGEAGGRGGSGGGGNEGGMEGCPKKRLTRALPRGSLPLLTRSLPLTNERYVLTWMPNDFHASLPNHVCSCASMDQIMPTTLAEYTCGQAVVRTWYGQEGNGEMMARRWAEAGAQ